MCSHEKSVLSYSVSYLQKSAVLIMLGKEKHVNSIANTIIFNVYSYFERQSQKSKVRGLPKLTSRRADATGYSERTIRRIVPEKKSLEGAAFGSPAKRYKVERKKIIVDDFDMEGIWHNVHEFYREKKYPMLVSLLVVVKEKYLFDGEQITPWKLLRKLGFRYKQVNDKRYVYEQPRIIVQRHEYRRRMQRNRREGRLVVYLD